MNKDSGQKNEVPDFKGAVSQLNNAASAQKCWKCGCLHSSLEAIEKSFPVDKRSKELDVSIRKARKKLTTVEYDCLGCKVCFPALAINDLKVAGGICPEEQAKQREGWPPFAGKFKIFHYQAPIAICTLTDALMETLASSENIETAIIGILQTENLGVERIIFNILSNPNIRFLLVCGEDSKQAIGHFPGHSLLSLADSGMDSQSRIIGAKGKRPFLLNISREAVEHFRQTVEVINLIDNSNAEEILETIRGCAERNPGPCKPFEAERAVKIIKGYIPKKMETDPAGYFVIYVDHHRQLLSVEHYQNNGVLDVIIEGRTAAELYIPSAEKNLFSRLDHAAYLGRELARAEHALLTGESYEQDAAPEESIWEQISKCHCPSSCGDKE
jgi:tetrahydromethanopterin S-methyltransferase subunit A